LLELIDEDTVAGIGGDASGGGVRLGDQTRVLVHRHVVADGRGRDAEVVAFDEGAGADRFARVRVVLHDGAESVEVSLPTDGVPPLNSCVRAAGAVCRTGRARRRSQVALTVAECQLYAVARERAIEPPTPTDGSC